MDWIDWKCASLTGDRLRGRGISRRVVGIVHVDQRRHASESLGGKWRDAEVPNVEDALLFVHLRLGSASIGFRWILDIHRELLRTECGDVGGTLDG